MARGFESKDVEFQQSEAERTKDSGSRILTPEERAAKARRETIALALARARADLASASLGRRSRDMLTQAIAAL